MIALDKAINERYLSCNSGYSKREVIVRPVTSRVLCFLTLFAAAVWGQSFLGSISGTITDASDAVLPQAKVVLIETKTGVQRDTIANASGDYSFADLPRGTYSISVTAAGFKEVK